MSEYQSTTSGIINQNVPLVSVIVTTYERRDMVCGAIETVLNQTYKNVEIIVVDDNSDYDVKSTLSEYRSDIDLLINRKNRGANWSRAVGITHATGDYIAFLDDDDRWHPTKLEKQVQALQNSGPSVGVTAVGLERSSSGRTSIPPSLSGEALTRELLAGENVIGGFSTIMVKRSLVCAAGLPDIHLDSAQDLEWYIRLSVNCQFVIINEELVYYNDNGDMRRITDERKTQMDDSYGRILEVHSDIVDEFGLLYRRKVHSRRNRFLAFFAAEVGEYSKCRRHAVSALLLYPLHTLPYVFLFIGLTGSYGYRAVKSVYDRFPW